MIYAFFLVIGQAGKARRLSVFKCNFQLLQQLKLFFGCLVTTLDLLGDAFFSLLN